MPHHPPLASDGVANFTVVRSDYANPAVTAEAVLLRKALGTVTGAEFALATDWAKDKPSDSELASRYEILIGSTNRPESTEAAAMLTGGDDYIIKMIGRKLVFAASSDRALTSAVEYFCSHIGYISESNFNAVNELSFDSGYVHTGCMK